MNPESRIIPRNRVRDSLHRRLEVRMARVEVEPLLQDVMRGQWWEFFDDRRMMRVVRADQDAVPLPPAGLRRLDEDHHLAAEQVDGESPEHPLGEEGGIILEHLTDPFVVERFHAANAGRSWPR